MVALSHRIAMPNINLDPIFSISTPGRTGKKVGGEKRSFLMMKVGLTESPHQNLKISKSPPFQRPWVTTVSCLLEKEIPGMELEKFTAPPTACEKCLLSSSIASHCLIAQSGFSANPPKVIRPLERLASGRNVVLYVSLIKFTYLLLLPNKPSSFHKSLFSKSCPKTKNGLWQYLS